MHIRTAAIDDVSKIVQLYKEVAKIKGGIARLENEITEEYVENFVKKSIADGLILVAIHPDDPDRFIGEMHAYNPSIHVFKHLLSDLTIAVHPEFQGRKIGRTLFTIFLEEIALNRTDIGKVELITREGNVKAINFYQSLGFKIEGRRVRRIKTPAGFYEADIPMGWQNPNFEF